MAKNRNLDSGQSFVFQFPSTPENKFWASVIMVSLGPKSKATFKGKGGNSQNFLGKFVRFLVTLRCFYRKVIKKK
jgi:hypothetical protein